MGDKPNVRLRFDMAHELGHILLHEWDENNEYLFNPGLDLKLEIRSTHKLIVFGEN